MNLRFKPQGRRIRDIHELYDGQKVQAIAYYMDRSIRKKVVGGYIEFENKYKIFDNPINLVSGEFKAILGYVKPDGTIIDRYLNKHKIYTYNKLIIRNKTMANKLMSLLKLNKNQRKLNKVGVYDENGNLTKDGQEFLLNLLAKEYEAKMVELAKDVKTAKKKKSDDDEDDD